MKQEQFFSLLRTILTLAGAVLVGGGLKFFGIVVDDAYWQEITGIILSVVSVIWSISTKTVDIEKLQGTIRQVVTFICGILLAKGLINDHTVTIIFALIGAILPFIQAGLSRKKSEQLKTGAIQVHQLKTNVPPQP